MKPAEIAVYVSRNDDEVTGATRQHRVDVPAHSIFARLHFSLNLKFDDDGFLVRRTMEQLA